MTRTRIVLILLIGALLLRTGGAIYSLGTEAFSAIQYSALAQPPGIEVRACADRPALARAAASAVPPGADDRLGLTQAFYSRFGLGYGAGDGYGYGTSQVDFTRWEVGRGVLHPETGSAWWRAVNGAVLRDMLEAHYLHSAGLDTCGGSNQAVTAWLAYLDTPSPQSWYAAHNASIVAGYRAYEALAEAEPVAERLMLANTLYRVTLADRMVSAPALLIPALSDPRGAAVALITSLPVFYPADYPLTPDQAEDSVLLYVVERNPIVYAGADLSAAVRWLRDYGMPGEEIERLLSGSVNLYGDLFPWFDPTHSALD